MTTALTLRYMRDDDVSIVAQIDRESFTSPWSENSFRFELQENTASHMIVLAEADGVIGFAGMWLIEDEAHVSTIAVTEARRGTGFGELLLAGLLRRGIGLGAAYAVLEVRVSNASAIRLYHKYEFESVQRRKNYYKDTGEDAYMMFATNINADAYRARLEERWAALQARLTFADRLAEGHPPPDSPV